MERHALHRSEVDWRSVRDGARQRSANARNPADTYQAIEWALSRLGDEHSFFSPPDRGSAAIASGAYDAEVSFPSGHRRADGVAHLTIPGFRGSTADVLTYARTSHDLIDGLEREEVAGWIVDLAANGGGNMLPMLAGLGPLLGGRVVGAFRFPDGSQEPWVYEATGVLWIGDWCAVRPPVERTGPDPDQARVAVILGPKTASSGEAVAVAFRGRPETRSFGQPTRGLSTSNDSFDLADGATLMITVARFEDRDGTVYGGPIEPDETSGSTAVDTAAGWVLRAGDAP